MSFSTFAYRPLLTKCAICGVAACALHGPFAHFSHMKSECPIATKVECVALRDYGAQPDLEGRNALRVAELSTSTTSYSTGFGSSSTQPSS
jgi:hypothetical protein